MSHAKTFACAAALAVAAGCSVWGGAATRQAAQPLAVEELPPGMNTEAYARIDENQFLAASDNPLSTFSIDVDTASYANVRRFLRDGSRPPKDAVRIEELINYFPYADPPPVGARPFAARVEVAGCPWSAGHRLVRIGLKGREIPLAKRPPSRLTFLVDVSGSMMPPNKLPLLKRALALLVERLDERDSVAMVVYAGNSGLVLPPTGGADHARILEALDRLEAGGSTNGAAGIQLAYRVAQEQFVPGAVNRVILATDGDFNVGVSDEGSLTRLIEEKAKSGVFLTVLGFGMGNVKDATMEKLADRGNGNYAYIDSLGEARKVLVEQAAGTLITIAKDVKVQVEFNPARVGAYRLIGYEDRLLKKEDFNDDKVDAGEIGAGHTVTALYEVVPVGEKVALPKVDALKYQRPAVATGGDELLTVKLRWKQPDGDASDKLELPVRDGGATFAEASADLRFAAAVAEFGMLLRGSPNKGDATWAQARALAEGSLGTDPSGYRREFVDLVAAAARL